MSMSKWKFYTINILSLVLGLILVVVFSYSYTAGKKEVSEELLHAFYTFDLNTIADNDKRIKELTTEEIYESHTIASSNRQLRVYLKFQGEPTEARIISHKDDTIFYYIDSKGFDPDRTFAMQYKYSWGKITDVVEYEVFFLPQSSRDSLK